MNPDLLLSNCPNGCAGELYQTSLTVAEGNLNQCRLCGQLLSACTKARYESSNQAWNTENGTWPSEIDMKRLIKRKKRDIHIISTLLANKNAIRLLDIGCSNGSFLWYANSLGGICAEGVDPSEKAVDNGRKRGLTIHQGYLHDIAFANNNFDAITLYEVIEHVDEPKALLEECYRILKPNGVLLIGTGNVNSWTRWLRKSKWDFFDMNAHGGHISFFSPASLHVLASRTGFTIKKVRTSSVKIFEKHETSYLVYRVSKILSEILNMPARLLNKGHQMEVYLLANKTPTG